MQANIESSCHPVFGKRCMSEAETALYLNVSRSSLRQGRMDGMRANRMPPPPYVRLGRKIVYLLDDLERWLQEHRIENQVGV